MTKRQLFIDGQLFQTSDWHRGMGKITVEYVRALLKHPDFLRDYDVTLVYNEKLRNAEREQEVTGALPDITNEPLWADLLLPTSGQSYQKASEQNRQTLTALLAEQPGNADEAVYFIPALFVHDVFPVFPNGPRTMLLFHDLIPMLFPDYYLQNEDQRQYYFERFPEIFASDVVLANSNLTRDDLTRFLCLDPERVVVVPGAGFDRSGFKVSKPNTRITKPYMLFPSGDDRRKNNVRCVEAFKKFNAAHGDKYQLVINSNFGEGTQKQLQAICSDVVFSGNVSDGELRWLFKHSELVFFGTEYEGLGLPLLEAMAEGVERIVCSNIAVFEDIARDDAVVFCDPTDVTNMAQALEEGLHMKPIKQYAALKRFTWDLTGAALLKALGTFATLPSRTTTAKPRIAVVGPDPRGFSAIGKFIAELHPAVSQLCNVDYYFEMSELTSGEPKASFLPYVAKWYDVRELTAARYAEYDAVWYHLGNSDYHIETAKRALSYPGFITFHDTRLRGLFDQMVQRGHISAGRYRTEESFKGLREAEFIASASNSARGILVHSQDAYEKVTHQLLAKKPSNTRKLFHPMSLAGERVVPASITIGFGGFATPRASDTSLQTLQAMLADPRFAHCKFEVFGFDRGGDDNFLGAVQRAISPDPRLRVSANLTDLEFQDKLRSLDIFVNYREAYYGETSRLTLESMRYGLAVLVHDVGWYAELPDAAAAKLASSDQILESAATLVQNEPGLRNMQRAAKQYAAELKPTAYAQTMLDMLQVNQLTQAPAAFREVWAAGLSSQLPATTAPQTKEFLDE